MYLSILCDLILKLCHKSIFRNCPWRLLKKWNHFAWISFEITEGKNVNSNNSYKNLFLMSLNTSQQLSFSSQLLRVSPPNLHLHPFLIFFLFIIYSYIPILHLHHHRFPASSLFIKSSSVLRHITKCPRLDGISSVGFHCSVRISSVINCMWISSIRPSNYYEYMTLYFD